MAGDGDGDGDCSYRHWHSYKETRKHLEHAKMAGYVADAQFGIPTRCPCGGWMKAGVSPTPKYRYDFDTQPGSRYWTCSKFEDDGLHFHQPWVFGVEQEIQKVLMDLEAQSKTLLQCGQKWRS